MRRFDLHVATSIEDALDYLSRYGEETEVLAGGTDLVVRMREGRVSPARVLDISRLAPLREIGEEREGPRLCLRIGALATHTQVVSSPLVGRWTPLLAEACRTVGSLQIRNRGTLGGNCITASPAGDSLPALVALEAEMVLLSAAGQRRVRSQEFFTGPGTTVRRRDELLGWLLVPAQERDERSVYLKLGQRNALAISVASVAVRLIPAREAGDWVCARALVAFGALAPTVVRGHRVEAALAGKRLDASTIERASALARVEVSPITDIRGSAEYRREMAAVLVRQALCALRGKHPSGPTRGGPGGYPGGKEGGAG